MPGDTFQLMPRILGNRPQHGRLTCLLTQRLLSRLGGVLGDVCQRLLHDRALGELLLQFSQGFLRIVLRILSHIRQFLGLVVGFLQRLLHTQLLLHLGQLIQVLLGHFLSTFHLGKVLCQLLQRIRRLLLGLGRFLQGLCLGLRLLRLGACFRLD